MVYKISASSSRSRLPGLHRKHRPDKLIAQPVCEPVLPAADGEYLEEETAPRSVLLDALALTVLVGTPMVLIFALIEMMWSLSFI